MCEKYLNDLDIHLSFEEIERMSQWNFKKQKMSKLVFRARSQMLDIETQQNWNNSDRNCVGCKIKDESGEELLTCEMLNKQNNVNANPVKYDWFY